ncbi:MAG: methylthioribulose 1-phosphate dehydratase [Pseudomonadota bacterium]
MADERKALIAAACHFYQRGWMVGTAGNLSARSANGGFWITASGRHKGELDELDFIRLDLDGMVLEAPDVAARPSAEISIHQAIYRCFPEAGAIYHVHSVEANVVSYWAADGRLRLPALEMLKGLGRWEAEPAVDLPVFENLPHVPDIARRIEAQLQEAPPAVPALLIHLHGATVWGQSPRAALHHTELLEYIFRFMVTARMAGLGGAQ